MWRANAFAQKVKDMVTSFPKMTHRAIFIEFNFLRMKTFTRVKSTYESYALVGHPLYSCGVSGSRLYGGTLPSL